MGRPGNRKVNGFYESILDPVRTKPQAVRSMSENRSLQSATATSEDQLFKVLSRPSLFEMKTKYLEFVKSCHWTISDRREFFISHGWTQEEFLHKHRELGIPYPHD